jgi:uncharacterized protein YjbI with pentapeptide repeats
MYQQARSVTGGGTVDESARQADGDDSATPRADKWGDPISEGRQAELRALFEQQKAWVAQPEPTRGESVFRGVRLTGAEVYWLAMESAPNAIGDAPHLHLESADLSGAQLAGADLRGAQLAGALLIEAQLAGANLSKAQLEGAHLTLAQLGVANLSDAQLQGAYLTAAQLKGANLSDAQLKGVDFSEAQLEGANLSDAKLEGADLTGAQLAEALLLGAQLKGANLTLATFDKTTHLNNVVLTGASLDQVTYDGVNLTVVDWSLVPLLGDEVTARQRKDKDNNDKPKDRRVRLLEFTAAVRANRVLAVTLRSQGMNEDADRYAYRAQLLQRTVLRRRRRWGAAFGSWLLDVVSGYGYKPVRSVIAYVAIIAFFAGLYLLNGQFAAPHLRWDEALVLSISSFHGRGFFTTGISLGDTLARLAAAEAIIGLLIEITFIATFTQRFFAR